MKLCIFTLIVAGCLLAAATGLNFLSDISADAVIKRTLPTSGSAFEGFIFSTNYTNPPIGCNFTRVSCRFSCLSGGNPSYNPGITAVFFPVATNASAEPHQPPTPLSPTYSSGTSLGTQNPTLSCSSGAPVWLSWNMNINASGNAMYGFAFAYSGAQPVGIETATFQRPPPFNFSFVSEAGFRPAGGVAGNNLVPDISAMCNVSGALITPPPSPAPSPSSAPSITNSPGPTPSESSSPSISISNSVSSSNTGLPSATSSILPSISSSTAMSVTPTTPASIPVSPSESVPASVSPSPASISTTPTVSQSGPVPPSPFATESASVLPSVSASTAASPTESGPVTSTSSITASLTPTASATTTATCTGACSPAPSVSATPSGVSASASWSASSTASPSSTSTPSSSLSTGASPSNTPSFSSSPSATMSFNYSAPPTPSRSPDGGASSPTDTDTAVLAGKVTAGIVVPALVLGAAFIGYRAGCCSGSGRRLRAPPQSLRRGQIQVPEWGANPVAQAPATPTSPGPASPASPGSVSSPNPFHQSQRALLNNNSNQV